MLSRLAEDHEIYLVAFVRDHRDLEYKDDLKKFCKEVHFIPVHGLISKLYALVALVTFTPLTKGFFFSTKASKIVGGLIKKIDFDIAMAICSSTSGYILSLDKKFRTTDFVDIDSRKWFEYSKMASWPKSWIFSREHKLLEKWEKEIALTEELSVVITPREKELLEEGAAEASEKIMVVPIGIDTEYFSPKQIKTIHPTLVFTGQMDYLPNIDAAVFFYLNILPRIREKLPETEFYIVGRKPDPSLAETCKTAVVTGEVDDIRPWLYKADVFVAPMRLAFGIQNKILEAMACGIPVVCTSRILQGMNVEIGKNILAADSAETFSSAVLELLDSEKLTKDLSESGLNYVRKHHSQETVYDPLNKVLCNGVGK